MVIKFVDSNNVEQRFDIGGCACSLVDSLGNMIDIRGRSSGFLVSCVKPLVIEPRAIGLFKVSCE